MKDEPPTQEQKDILDSTARITLVKAGPGSGKTRVFVEALAMEIKDYDYRKRVAALSFTNIAQEEIGRRIKGFDRNHHFLGTLDSFFLRFVVRPFAHLVGINKGVELVPASVQASIKFSTVQVGNSPQDRVQIGDISFVGGSGDKPKLAFWRWKKELVPEMRIQNVLKEKIKFWAYTRMITHSDSHFLAASILASKYGNDVIAVLAKRFPMILIDEFQDTNWFHSRALVRLLGNENIRALIVGDPMQSIYEFGGADPAIFDEVAKLSGSKIFELSKTHRCPVSVANALSIFKGSCDEIKSSKTNEGRACFLIHTLNKAGPDRALIAAIKNLAAENSEVAVLVRRDSTIEELTGQAAEEEVEGSLPCARLNEASHKLLRGDSKGAVDLAGQVLANFVLNEQRPTAARLRDAGISIKAWRASVFRILQAAVGQSGQSWQEWSEQVRKRMETEVFSISGIQKKLGTQIKAVKNTGIRLQATHKSASSWPSNVKFSNIHQVKGAEFDVVVLFVPRLSKKQPCPSVEWWNVSSEERRVAFVAMSRPKATLIICVHKETYQNLQSKHPQFVAAFETKYVGEALQV